MNNKSNEIEKPQGNPSCEQRLIRQFAEVGRILKDTQDQLQDMRAERDWLLHLVATIRDKGNLRYNGNSHLLAFSDLKDEANRTFYSMPNARHHLPPEVQPRQLLADRLQHENSKLRQIIESVARDLAKGDAVAYQCYIDLNETIIDLYGKEIPLSNAESSHGGKELES